VLAVANKRAERRRAELAPIVAKLERLTLLDGAGQAAIIAVAAGARTMSTAEGDVVVSENEPADALYVIERGEFIVSARGETGDRPVEIARLGVDDYFGEIGVLSGGVRTATVTSAGLGSLLRLDGPSFADAVSLAPAMPRALRDSLRARLSRTHPRLAAELEEPSA
jgi:CRP-like cAMP-binding protein